MTSVNEHELAWLAGILDGEGSFYLTATHSTTGYKVVKYSIAVGNTNMLMILELKRVLEILLDREIRYYNIKGRGNRKRSWLIQVTSARDLKIVCESVMPFIVAKKAQAELMLEFIEAGTSLGSNQTTGPDVSLFEKRLPFVARMKHLNRYHTGAQENAQELLSQQETELPAPSTGEETVRTASRDAEASTAHA